MADHPEPRLAGLVSWLIFPLDFLESTSDITTMRNNWIGNEYVFLRTMDLIFHLPLLILSIKVLRQLVKADCVDFSHVVNNKRE